ncbi:OmpA family protein [Alcanivorax sp.]|uniref:OmpA family protein n=1 Tax=Alcanivorax sp. TaxID=1872427 RepID=UPI0025C2B693|nr:OmpA family protein [Alcanivorax sp.]
MNRLTVLTKTMKRLSMKMASPRAIGAPGRAGVLTVLIMGIALPLQAEQIAAPQTEQALPAPDVRVTPSLGEAVERQLPLYMDYQTWVQDPSRYEQNLGDRIETVTEDVENLRTIKLTDVVPPIRYQSGVSEIPASYVERLRAVLENMRGRLNVRLHFVGHSDNVPLFGALRARLGDNTGLSRERAGAAAEYFQVALDLPPESISYEGMGESQPLASNDTSAGRAENRRVEVEVWYDEVEQNTVEKEVVVEEKLNRVKVCRVETVCKLTYKEGHSKRTRVKNLVPPLHFNDESVEIPASFQNHIRQALENLANKQNVTLRLIGYTDNAVITGRDARIYGTHEGLSKARARRALLALQDALGLPSSMLESTGKGSSNPIASNESESGRALNRRVEVEFWYDDILQSLSGEPQMCPEDAGAETVTRTYDPPSGPIAPVIYKQGNPDIPEGYMTRLSGILADVQDKTNVRLRFIGYTSNERLDRRTAMVYGDDVGLSTARARRVMEAVSEQLKLTEEQTEWEGRGHVQTDDVVNAGFVESDVSRVDVEVVYDELAVLDDLEGVDIQRLTREVDIANPYALNLMRISVDGKAIDDPLKSSADVQRCTDVALEKADIQFKFDNLEIKPRLNVTAWPNTVMREDNPDTEGPDNLVQFRAYSNYPAYLEKAEVRLFELGKSVRDEPLAVIELPVNGDAEWQVELDESITSNTDLRYLLRVYDSEGRYDETAPQTLWVVNSLTADDLADKKDEYLSPDEELKVGYGENRLVRSEIPLDGGTIRVYGSEIPEGREVFVAGRSVPVATEGEFAVEEILPPGLHTVEVAVIDNEGNGDLFLRDLELEKNDWFYVGVADVTASYGETTGPAKLVTDDEYYDDKFNLYGRLAYYTRGKFGDNWQLTSSADTLDGPVDDLFSGFMDKSPDALFRRIDPDYYFPTYGDDSTVEDGAPTLGKFYLRVQRDDDYGMWGNFHTSYLDTTLAQVDRSLYGGKLHYESDSVTSFGEQRLLVDGFVADPGTLAGRDEFRGTGGSLYYLRHLDVLEGSDRVRVEVRDKASGMVLAVKNLVPGIDYDIDYLQGRLMLNEPLSPSMADELLVSTDAGSDNDVFLVARYEYTFSFEETSDLSQGGRMHYWFGDHVKLGLTANNTSEEGSSDLGSVDLTLRKNARTWLKTEFASSEGTDTSTFFSTDGGYNFDGVSNGALPGEDISADANRVDASVGFRDIWDKSVDGNMTVYRQEVEAGYSAPGQITAKDTEQQGGSLHVPVTKSTSVTVKADSLEQEQGLDTSAAELNVTQRLNAQWQVSAGVRQEQREDNSPVVPLTQIEGDRTDVVVRGDYDSLGRWAAYGYAQDTASSNGTQEDNARLGAGGEVRISDRWRTNGEVSGGDLGVGAQAGTEFQVSDRSNLYLNYALENERSDNGVRARRGNMATGVRSRYSDTTSVYLEERYTHGDVPTGLTHATGIDIAPNDRWNYGASLDFGTLRDRQTGAEQERRAIGAKVGYGYKTVQMASVLEYRIDKLEAEDLSHSERKTWLTKNSLKYQFTPDWRLIGRLNYSDSISSQGDFYDGRFIEAIFGYGYRPVYNDRLNVLAKYTYFYNLPTADQVTVNNTSTEFIQKSHILSVDAIYDLTRRWSIGGKYAYRLGQISQDRDDPEFFDSRASLYVARIDWHFIRKWDATLEGRLLDLPDAEDSRSGVLTAIYRHLNDNIKFGVGYNFSSFSDDLTDLDYDHEGAFINLVGKI